MSYRVIIGERARPVAEKIRKEGGPEVRAAYAWLCDQLALHADELGIELRHPGIGAARVKGIGDLTGVWTLPGHNIVILRVLHWPGFSE